MRDLVQNWMMDNGSRTPELSAPRALLSVSTDEPPRAQWLSLGVQKAPLVEWLHLGALILKSNTLLLTAFMVSLPSTVQCGPRTKAVRVPDNSLAPELPAGWTVLIDPDSSVGEGDIVLARMRDGLMHLRFLTELANGEFNLRCTWPVAQTWNSVKHGVSIVGRVISQHFDRPHRPPRVA